MLFYVLIALMLIAILYANYQLSRSNDERDLTESIDTEVKKFTKKFVKSAPIDALIIGVYKDGETLFKGYGESEPNDLTIFQIASLSKLFTSALLVILCDEGICSMETSLEELIGDKYQLSPEAKTVTLYQLVTHTSGFPKVPEPLMDIIREKAGEDNIFDNPYSHIELDDVLHYLTTTKGKQKPGKFNYSNYGMGLLGHIMEMLTGKNLEELAKEKLFQPLGMIDTSISLSPQMREQLVQGYSSTGNEAELWNANALAGAGAFNSSAGDMMKFLIASTDCHSLLSSIPESVLSSEIGNGIGWMPSGLIEKLFGNKKIAWHNGMVGGYASYIAIELEAHSGVVILANKSIDVTILGIMLMREIRAKP